MADVIDQLGMYLHLARASQLRRRPLVRDRLLVIAGAIAAKASLPRVAALCREKILQHNHAHLVGRWETLRDALADDEFLQFLKQLERRFPSEKAEQMLHSLGIHMANERQTYFSDEEYAASIWGVTLADLDEQFGAADDVAE